MLSSTNIAFFTLQLRVFYWSDSEINVVIISTFSSCVIQISYNRIYVWIFFRKCTLLLYRDDTVVV